MAKFAIECPKCSSVNTASNFIFAKKVIKCGTCGSDINIKENSLVSKVCPHCNHVFVYDVTKGADKRCPNCSEKIHVQDMATVKYSLTEMSCPQCACTIEVDKTKPEAFCPVCDVQIDVKRELAKQKLVTDTGISVIQYEGDNSTFVWKHPIENFNHGSQLIVHESQEAVLFLSGEALDTFGPGRHTLDTQNIPVLKKVYSLPTAPQTPFHCEVYFINRAVQMGLKWGTDSRVRFIDPVTGIPLDIGASGEMSLQVSDARRLLVKLVGTTGGLTNKEILCASSDADGTVHRTLKSFFRAPLMTEVKAYLASAIKAMNINILEIDSKLGILSEALRERVTARFEEYGLTVPEFYVTNVVLPEEDRNFQEIKNLISAAYIGVKSEEVKANIASASRERQIIEEQTKAQLELIRAQGEAEAARMRGMAEADVMRAKGYSQKDVLDSEVQKAYAEGIGNMGSGSGSGAGGGIGADMVGLFAGMKMAESVADRLGGVMGGQSTATPTPTAPTAPTWRCNCGESANVGRFCMACGAPRPSEDGTWTCSCGHSANRGKFCAECGAPRPVEDGTWTCSCGHSANVGKFCAECGAKKPE